VKVRRRRRRRELVVVVVVGLDVAETSWLLEMWVEIGKTGTSMGWGWSKKLSWIASPNWCKEGGDGEERGDGGKRGDGVQEELTGSRKGGTGQPPTSWQHWICVSSDHQFWWSSIPSPPSPPSPFFLSSHKLYLSPDPCCSWNECIDSIGFWNNIR